MKVDLTQRDIELLLFLVNEAAAGESGLKKRTKFTIQELALLTKLEKALKNEDIIEKIVYNASKSNILH